MSRPQKAFIPTTQMVVDEVKKVVGYGPQKVIGPYCEDVDDLTQETIQRANENLERLKAKSKASFRSKASFKKWVRSIVRSVRVDLGRYADRRKRGGHIEHVSEANSVIGDSTFRPDKECMNKEYEELFEYLVNKLPEVPKDLREIHALYCQDMTYNAIAKKLRISPHTVKKRVKEALGCILEHARNEGLLESLLELTKKEGSSDV